MAAIAARAARFLPALAHTSVIRSYAGLRPWTPDHQPVVGPVAAAPGTGQIVAECLVSDTMPALAEPIRPERFL